MARLNRKEYQKRLPKKRISAGCLLFNDAGEMLIVNPTYKDGWEIPGGTVEENESPRQGCVRELREELGVDWEPVRLLVVDFTGETSERTESLNFIFDGGVLPADLIARIVLPPRELSEYRFLPPQIAVNLLKRRLRLRVGKALEQRERGTTVYMEEQEPFFNH